MKKTVITSSFLLLSLLSFPACNSKIDDEAPQTVYQNPLFEPDLADPSFIRADDGWFYAYGTENTWETGVNRVIPIVRSQNLVKWEFVKNAFTAKPSWKSSGFLWAPQIVHPAGSRYYYLYYSFSTWGDTNPGIGVARSERPDGPFTDTGKILDTASSGVPNSIDPFYFQTGSGQRYLFWGSFNGIYGQEIAPDMRTLTGAKFKIAGNAFEATYIYEKDGKFWFFGSNGTCCEGADSKYHLSVAVADTIAGPYKTKDGKNILNNGQEGTPFLHGDSNTGWVGPGHNAEIIRDDNGRYFILYHAIASKNPLLPNGGATRRPLMMDEIIWGNDNWPTIAGGLPSSTPRQAPYFKN